MKLGNDKPKGPQYEISEQRILEGRPFSMKGLVERDTAPIPPRIPCDAVDDEGRQRRPKQSDIYPAGPWERRFDTSEQVSYWTHIDYSKRMTMWQYRRRVDADSGEVNDWQRKAAGEKE